MTDNDPIRPRLGDVLIAAGAVTESELKLALEEQRNWGSPLGMTLVRLGFLDEATLVRALASHLNMPVVSLRGKRVNAETLDLVPIATAEKYRCLPLLLNDDGAQRVLYLGMEDPTDNAVLQEISAEVGLTVQPVLVAPTELDECIHRHYHWESSGNAASDSALRSGPLPMKKPADESTEPKSLAGTTGSPLGTELQQDDEEVGLGLFVDSDLGVEDEVEAGFEPEPDPEVSIPGWPVEAEPEIPEVLEFAEPPPIVIPDKTAEAGSNDFMLRAIAQLLIEKGVFTRDELVDRLRSVAKEDA